MFNETAATAANGILRRLMPIRNSYLSKRVIKKGRKNVERKNK